MIRKNIFTNNDLAKEYVDELDFDPLYWLGLDPEETTMEQLFDISKIDEDQQEHRAVRYCDDEVCFEISFEHISNTATILGDIDTHADWFNFFEDKRGEKPEYYLITVFREL